MFYVHKIILLCHSELPQDVKDSGLICTLRKSCPRYPFSSNLPSPPFLRSAREFNGSARS